MEEKKIQLEQSQFDFIPFLFFLLRRWYVILAMVLLGYGAARFYLRYSIPEFQANARLVLNERTNEDPLDQIFGNKSRLTHKDRVMIENDLQKIRSEDVTALALSKLDWGISYFIEGRIRGVSEVDKDDVGYSVLVDSVHEYCTNLLFEIDEKDDHFEVTPFTEDPEDEGSVRYFFESEGAVLSDGRVGVKIYKNGRSSSPILNIRFKGTINDENTALFRINRSKTLINKYNSSLNVEKIGDDNSTIIGVYCNSSVESYAVDFVNALAESYIEYNIEEKKATLKSALSFIDREVELLDDSLNKIDVLITEFKVKRKIPSLELESTYIFNLYKDKLEETAEVQFKMDYLEQVFSYLEGQSGSENFAPPMLVGIADPSFNELNNRITEFYSERDNMLQGITPKSPEYQRVQKRVQETFDLLYLNVKNLIREQKLVMKSLSKQLGELELKLTQIPKEETYFSALQRNYLLNEKLYNLLLEKKMESGIQQASVISDHHILSVATEGAQIAPIGGKIQILGVALGLLIPTSILFLIFFFDTRIKSVSQIAEGSNAPFIGALPKVDEFGPAFIFNYPKSLLAESLRSLKSNINYMFKGEKTPVLLITSSQSGEGKTFTAENLGAIYAYANKKTVIIGGDLRRPRLFSEFGLRHEKGLSEYLSGQVEKEGIVVESGFRNLYIIGAGANPPNPAELLERDRFGILIDYLRDEFDLIIIDSPPYEVVTDTSIIADHAEAVLFVTRHNYTKREVLSRISHLAEKKLQNMGIVLNFFEQKAGYGYKYSHYSRSYGYAYRGYYGNVPTDSVYVDSVNKSSFMSKLKFWGKKDNS